MFCVRRRMTGAAMDEHDRGGGGDDCGDSAATGATQQQRTGGGDRHRWPPVVSSADIAEYDSSAAADPVGRRGQFPLAQPPRQRADKTAVGSAAAAYGRGSKSADPCKWKTRALYAFLAGLLAIVIVNLTLTLWFIRVTKFTAVRNARWF